MNRNLQIMKLIKTMLCICGFGLFAASCSNKAQTNEPFKYTVDEFADLQVLRYEIPGWDSLTLKQKEYIYFLSEAAKCGRDIIYVQNFIPETKPLKSTKILKCTPKECSLAMVFITTMQRIKLFQHVARIILKL